MRTKPRRDTVAVGLIWIFVIGGALLLTPRTEDDAGLGQTAAAVGLVLTSAYFWLRKLRRRGQVTLSSPGGTTPGAATSTWLKVVVAILLWVAGSVLALVAGLPDALAFWLGGLLALALLVPRLRRSARDLRRWPGPRKFRRSRR